MKVRHYASLAAALALTATPSLARQTNVPAAASSTNQTANLESFAPAFFAQFQPNTALDMVERIPGFTLRSGDDERGFGEANTNFLVNGRRPSTKSQDTEDILSRIPASTVVRIEVLDGASLDIPGLSGQVVNVVARAVELSGRWRYSARFEEGTEPQVLEGEVLLSGRSGDLGFSIGLKSRQFTFTEDSIEQYFDTDRSLVEDRTEDVYLRNIAPSASLNLTWTPSVGQFAGHVSNLSASIEKGNENNGLREVFTAVGPTGQTGQSFVDVGEDEVEFEVSGDYAFPLRLGSLDGTLKLIGLNTRQDGTNSTILVGARDGEIPIRIAFSEDYKEGETIGRGEYGFNIGSDHDVQISAEYAYNFLDSVTQFETSSTRPIFDPVRVEEDRYNVRITDSWQISPRISLQSSLGAEYSTLQVVNPLSEARNFFRPKGFAAISYKASDRYTLRAKADRSVGQLDFGTFVSTRNLIDNLITSGNAEIKPSQSWEFSLELERSDDKLFSGQIRPYLELIQDPIDRILTNQNIEGPGNLDSATRYGVEANATLLFDTLGVPGLRVDVSGGIGDSEIEDPLTGEQRQVNFNEEYSYSVFSRYDIPKSNIAITGQIYNDETSPFYRLDDVRTINVLKPFLSLSLIHKNIFGMQMTISGTNLLDNVVIQERDRYLTAERRLGALVRSERFNRKRGRRLSLTLTDTF